MLPAKNFHITDEALGVGGPKAKYAMNIAAIRTLKQIESEHRQATPQEQEILSRYVGWGGLADAFDETKESWQGEYRELQGLLTDVEYASARESVLNAHYTSPTVIKAIYEALERMGFTTGNVLEPACGIGNFFGLVPDSMKDSRLYGIELDSITGRIAKQLYQNANIEVQGFEETSLPDSFFDLAIGNVPFGDYGVSDRQYDKHRFLIHDYFFGATRS
jgi:type I restriction-modification system DNA methylase subunit